MQIENNVFIVTGGASGLGAATARMLVAAGGKVVLADVQAEAGEALAAELGGERAARFVRCDVTSEADGQAVVAAALAMGALRGLVNCAGVAPAIKTVGKDGPHPLDAFQRAVNINLVGTFNMCRLAADAMGKQEGLAHGERGVIVNTASVAAFDGQIGQAAYGASKAGVAGMTLPMARDLSRRASSRRRC
jgi:NAD(P)-dependent dehydrogenase (short-subunit alcohol dehydrogenase family)